MRPMLTWAIEELDRPRTAPVALLLTLLTGVWRVPGGWLVLQGIARDLVEADPQGYLAGVGLLAAGAWLIADHCRAAGPLPRLLLGPRLAHASLEIEHC